MGNISYPRLIGLKGLGPKLLFRELRDNIAKATLIPIYP